MQTECTACSLHEDASCIVGSKGNPAAPLVLVGMAPGGEEDKSGIPFVGPAGAQLEHVVQEVFGTDRPDILYCNVVCCRPPNNRAPSRAEAGTCSSLRLIPLLHQHPRKLVVALGNVAWAAIRPLAQTTQKSRGIKSLNGAVLRHPDLDCWAGVTYHPAATLHDINTLEPMKAAFRRFRALLDGNVPTMDTDFELLDSLEGAVAALDNIGAGPCVLDVETTGLDPRQNQITLIAVNSKHHPVIIDWARIYRAYWERGEAQACLDQMGDALARLFSRAGMIGHNAKFDAEFLYTTFRRDEVLTWSDDTMIQHYLLDENSGHGLKPLAGQYLNAPDWEAEMQAKAFEKVPRGELETKHWSPIPVDKALRWIPTTDLAQYAAHDAEATLRLHERFTPELVEQGLESVYRDISIRLIPHLAAAEMRGMLIDVVLANEYRAALVRAEDRYVDTFRERFGADFNPHSTAQIRELLFETWAIPAYHGLDTTPTGKVSVGEPNLRVIASQTSDTALVGWLQAILYVRKVRKFRGTNIDGTLSEMDAENTVHTHFLQCPAIDEMEKEEGGTVTGRLSSTRPALQNIPAIMCPIFIARPGFVFIEADFSQTEVRMWALLSDDDVLVRVVQADDVHCMMLRETRPDLASLSDEQIKADYPNERTKAKHSTFAAIYRASPATVAARLGVSEQAAIEFIQAIEGRFVVGMKWIHGTVEFCRKHGYVRSYTGRRRRLPAIKHAVAGIRQEAERQGVNAPVQAGGADVCYTGMLQLADWLADRQLTLGGKVFIVNTVHDSILLEVAEEHAEGIAAELPAILHQDYATASGRSVPFPAEIKVSKRWKGEPDLKALGEYLAKETALN